MRTVRAVSDRRCVAWGAVLTGNEVSVLLSSREASVAPRVFRYALGRNPFIMTWLWGTPTPTSVRRLEIGMTESKSTSVPVSRLPTALGPALSHGVAEPILHSAAVFIDYDGTLTPIVARPDLAVLSDTVRALVRRLASTTHITIVSGRDIDVIRQLVAIDGLGYVGSHGLDIAGPLKFGLRRHVAEACTPALDAVESALRRRTEGIDGVLVERKRFSISTHVREVDPRWHPQVEAIVDELRLRHPTLRREGGKMLYELRPDVDWDKGAAVMWLLDGMGIDPSHALYIGDDLTDETAFAALGGRGTTVIVAGSDDDRPTAAQFRVDDPAEVATVLERLVEHRRSLPDR